MKQFSALLKRFLQDEGYIISNQDMAGGLVVAEAQKTNAPNLTLAFLHGINAGLGGRNYRHSYKTSQNFMISVNLEEIRNKKENSRSPYYSPPKKFLLGWRQNRK